MVFRIPEKIWKLALDAAGTILTSVQVQEAHPDSDGRNTRLNNP